MTISGVGSGATSGPVDEPPVSAPAEAASPEPAAAEAAPAATAGDGAPSGAWSTEGHLLQERASGWNAGTTPPAFDRWNLTPEVKRLFLALGDATSAEQAEQTVNALLEQGVPREQIEEVLEGNKGFFDKAWPLVKGGRWKTARLDEDGAIASRFEIDPARGRLLYETADRRLEIGKDGGVYATDDATATLEVRGSSGKLTYERDGADWRLEGDWKDEKKRGTVGGLSYVTGDPESGERRVRLEGRGGAGGSKGAAELSYRVREGERSDEVAAGLRLDKEGPAITTRYESVDGKDRSGVSGEIYVGDRRGGMLETSLSEAMFAARVRGFARTTEGEASRTDVVGGEIEVRAGDRDGKGADAPPVVRLSGKRSTVEGNDGSAQERIDLSAGLTVGETKASLGYATTDKSGADGARSTTDTYRASVSHTERWEDGGRKESFRTDLSASATVRDAGPDDVAATARFTHAVTGGGKPAESETVTLTGGQTSAAGIAKRTHTSGSDLVGDDKGHGVYGGLDLSMRRGDRTVSGGFTLGATDETTMAGAHLSVRDGKDFSLETSLGAAMRSDNMRLLMKTTASIAVGDRSTVGAGGQIEIAPGDPRFEPLWQAYASYGFQFDKKRSITVRLGVNDDGSRIAYVPQAVLAWDQVKITTAAQLSEGRSPTAGAMVSYGAVSVYGGYGDPTALNRGFLGTPGMGLPNAGADNVAQGSLGQGGFVGVKLDLLKVLRRLK